MECYLKAPCIIHYPLVWLQDDVPFHIICFRNGLFVTFTFATVEKLYRNAKCCSARGGEGNYKFLKYETHYKNKKKNVGSLFE